jgi:cobalamin-dependent methionine synthase I
VQHRARLAVRERGRADQRHGQTFDDYALQEIRPYIDWTPFFHSWQLKGSHPRILDDPEKGQEARKLFADAQELLDRIIAEKRLTARAVLGLFPANALEYDTVEIHTDESREEVLTRPDFLRQQKQKPPGRPNRSLADFIAPRSTALEDHVGLFAVTAGLGANEAALCLEEDNDDYNAIMVKALADRLGEGLGELMHRRVRTEFWGLRGGRGSGQGCLDPRGVRRHPPGTRLPCLPRALREAHPLEIARRGEQRWHHADRKLRDVARRCGQRLLLLTP